MDKGKPEHTTECEFFDARMEVKFVLPPTSLNQVRVFLDSRLRRRIFRDRVSRVVSVYLDTPSLDRITESMAGLPQRKKLRLRWYDSNLPEQYFYLELKERLGSCNRKQRHRFEVDRIQDHKYIRLQEMAWKVSDRLAVCLLQGDRPVVRIEYLREHFECPHVPVRITLDHGLRAALVQPFNPLVAIGKGIPFGDPVVEVKGPPEWLNEGLAMLRPLQLRKGRYSKYLQGCRVFRSQLGITAALVENDGYSMF